MNGPQAGECQRNEAIFDGLLVDLDGTLIDSTEAVVKHWADVGKRINVNPRVILEMSHGRRSLDVLQVIAPDFATWDFVRSIESVILVNHGHLAKEIPGAIDFLSALAAHSVPWALVTSTPKLLITAESVENGKPDPAAYVLGRERLGLVDEQFDILVIEDSPAGIAAGKAAGCRVIGLLTSHTYRQIASSTPDWILQDLRSLKILRNTNGKVVVEMSIVRRKA
ncbi:Haloacid dehalogenase-like hydrolase [Fusarium oxysporum f. sp. vasinfectum]|nr:Haloacid dehalogenase-like hydrolase [Fusarium oxysporum f. sp. vasinfectum]